MDTHRAGFALLRPEAILPDLGRFLDAGSGTRRSDGTTDDNRPPLNPSLAPAPAGVEDGAAATPLLRDAR